MKTWLFCPGNDQKKIKSALISGACSVIIDWEDGVSYHLKDTARQETIKILRRHYNDSVRVYIRISGQSGQEFEQDLENVSALPPGIGIMIPKVEGFPVIDELSALKRSIIPLIETAKGLESVAEIANSCKLIDYLAFGSLDFCADIGCLWTPSNPILQYARSRIVLAARAAELNGSIDGVYPRFRDEQGIYQDALAAKNMGFVGKLLIHPNQIAPVKQAFQPSQEEIRRAKEVIEASRLAMSNDGSAVTALADELVDLPVIQWAERVLREASYSPKTQGEELRR